MKPNKILNLNIKRLNIIYTVLDIYSTWLEKHCLLTSAVSTPLQKNQALNFDSINLHWFTMYKHLVVIILSAVYLSCPSFVFYSLQFNPWYPPRCWIKLLGKEEYGCSWWHRWTIHHVGMLEINILPFLIKVLRQNWVTCWEYIDQAQDRFVFFFWSVP